MTDSNLSTIAPSISTQARERFGLSEAELALLVEDPALRDFVYTVIPLAQSSSSSLQRAKEAVAKLHFFTFKP